MRPSVVLLPLALVLVPRPVLAQQPAGDVAEVQAQAPASTTRITARLVLRVDDRQAALDQAVALAQARGGWFSSLGTDQVVLRVPVARVEDLMAELRADAELVERGYEASELRTRRTDLVSQIAAREKMFDRYEDALAQASSSAIVAVQREITRLVAEIEALKGQLRVLDDQAAHATVTVAFRYQERRAPVRTGTSSFDWINSLNVADVLDDFQLGARATRSRADAVAPEGFAPFDRTGRFQAVSPDDVLYRVRSANNDPEADLEFWSEALRTRMLEAGYHLESETPVTAAGGTGTRFQLGAASGEQDLTYVITLFVADRHLILVEAVGEAERYRKRAAAIDAAIAQVGW